MNFGDILDEWERGKSHAYREKSGVMESWLHSGEVFDKDTALHEAQPPGERRRRLLFEKPDDVIDIHGLTSDKAWLSLELFFTRARNCGFEKLRIVHGKGNHTTGEAVLGRTVRDFIEQCPYAGECGHEKAVGGGSGATWVLLKDGNL
ncbi:MAG: Smr/MutS family protein [Treponema sp.]|jgi:DNA-nicking Smr family endonuclease|nr:Smr/MutS family protein [Treponema sp.]